MVLPYATWTVVYFALGVAEAGRIGSVADDAGHLGWLLLTGYDQLYFLVVLLQFYLIYPAFLWLIRRTQRHHGWLLGASLAVEAVLFWLVHEQYVPAWMLNKGATRELWNYELFVIAGGVVAWHYHEVHGVAGPALAPAAGRDGRRGGAQRDLVRAGFPRRTGIPHRGPLGSVPAGGDPALPRADYGDLPARGRDGGSAPASPGCAPWSVPGRTTPTASTSARCCSSPR